MILVSSLLGPPSRCSTIGVINNSTFFAAGVICAMEGSSFILHVISNTLQTKLRRVFFANIVLVLNV